MSEPVFGEIITYPAPPPVDDGAAPVDEKQGAAAFGAPDVAAGPTAEDILGAFARPLPIAVSPHYRQEGTWNGYPKFRCGYCQFEALNEPDIIEHVKTHIETRVATPRPSGIVDLQGNPI